MPGCLRADSGMGADTGVTGIAGAGMGTAGRTGAGMGTAGAGDGSAVVIGIDALQFHCMEELLPNTSAPSAFFRAFHVITRLLQHSAGIFILSVFLGGLVMLYVLQAPFDRLVVYNQPASTTVKITSAKLSKPGFVVVYMQGNGGWEAVGWSWLLEPGLYQNLAIDIGVHTGIEPVDKDNVQGNFVMRSFVVRILEYKGNTRMFDEQVDTPVRDRSGNVYQKRFWWARYGHAVRQFFVRLEDAPLVYLWDVLWP